MKQTLLFKNQLKNNSLHMVFRYHSKFILNLFPLPASAIPVFIRHAG